jgi:FAD/FMN-containing dehydrogenase
MKVAALTLILPLAVSQAANPLPVATDCKVLPSDPTWPERSVWRAAMPEIERGKSTEGKKRPDYRLEASTVDEVIAAVKFAKKYNVRLTVLNSGHDL